MKVPAAFLAIASVLLSQLGCGSSPGDPDPRPIVEESTCGDGNLDTGEECDDGPRNGRTADACRPSCSLPACGDGIRDTGEACDLGPGNDDAAPDACRTDCSLPRCGDGVVNAGEGCDDGAQNGTGLACRENCAPAGCGDGVVGGTEACDDGPDNSDVRPDACRTTCVRARCGDGVRDGAEACDQGARNSDTEPDACRIGCVRPACGDGVLDAGEACDDGPENSDSLPGACRASCTPARCGDGVRDPGEACDDGPENSDTRAGSCRTDCTSPTCGDGVRDAGEGCDEGVANSDVAPDACRTSCAPPSCGDGVVDSAEGCDDGAANGEAPGACRPDCVPPRCGDGVIDPGEACDDGPANSDRLADACRRSCTLPSCGDGVVDIEEACDEGAANADLLPGACRSSCTLPHCGDGVVDPGEGCDDGAANSDVLVDACRAGCVPAGCGDGVRDAAELCDDGAANSDATPGACRTTCLSAGCGDGVTDAGEACDDGAANSDLQADACRTVCTLPTCGDGVRDAGEACDDGAANDDAAPDACRTTCERPRCGDGVVDAGEGCDDGAANGDGPPAACRTTCLAARCGDGVVDAGEGCDDGNRLAGDGCDALCRAEPCGDGALSSGEDCDDGNRVAGDGCSASCRWEFAGTCTSTYGATAPILDARVVGTPDGGNGFRYTGDTTYGTSALSSTCGAGAPEDHFAYVPPIAGDLVIEAVPFTRAFKVSLAARRPCTTAGELACGPPWEAAVPGERALLVVHDVRPEDGPVYVQVDGASGTKGIYDLHVYMAAPLPLGATCRLDETLGRCQPGLLACADPDGDGTGLCVPEVTEQGACDPALTASLCAPGLECTGTPARCWPICSNGRIDPGEDCDDGNRVDGDDCSASCIEEGHDCAAPRNLDHAWDPVTRSAVWEATITPAESDDFRPSCVVYNGGDLVARFTAPEAGRYTFGGRSTTRVALAVRDVPCGSGGPELSCSEGYVETTHALDLAAGQAVFVVLDSDTYSDVRPVSIEVRRQVCGDGQWVWPEECDDGNLLPGDGCDGACQAEGDDCTSARLLAWDAAAAEARWDGRIDHYVHHFVGSCDTDTLTGPDVVLAFDAPEAATYAFQLEGETHDPVVYLLGPACSPMAAELACAGTNGYGLPEIATRTLAAGERVHVVADTGANLSSSPRWHPNTLRVRKLLCGDGVRVPPEHCDDGNTVGGDGCGPTCLAETLPAATNNETLATAAPVLVGYTYQGTAAAERERWFRFDATAGESYTFETFAGAHNTCRAGSSSGYNTKLSLQDPAGVELAFDDDSGLSTCSRIDWIAPASGAYHLRLSAGFYSISPFYLQLRRNPAGVTP